MSWTHLMIKPVGRLAGMAASGVLGVAIVESVRSGRARRATRSGAVTATAWGLRAQRTLEERAEGLRLGLGDILAEARERVGDEAPAPADQTSHDHEH